MNKIKKSLLYSTTALTLASSLAPAMTVAANEVETTATEGLYEQFKDLMRPAKLYGVHEYVRTPDATKAPYNNAVQIKSGLGNSYTHGTGGFIANNIILTNAHVIYSQQQHKYKDMIELGLYQNAETNVATANPFAQSVTPKSWQVLNLSGYEDNNPNTWTFEHDIGIIILDEPVSIEHPDIQINSIVDKALTVIEATGKNISLTGYPGFSQYPELAATKDYKSGQQYTVSGPIVGVDENNLMYFKMDYVGGASGSNAVDTSTGKVIGVGAFEIPRYNSSGEETSSTGHNGGVLFNQTQIDQIKKIIAENTITGFYDKGGKTYYFDPATTALQKGFLNLDKADGNRKEGTYYLDPKTGEMVKGTTLKINGQDYTFAEDGRLETKDAVITINLTFDGTTLETKTETVTMNSAKGSFDVTSQVPEVIEKDGKTYRLKSALTDAKGEISEGENKTLEFEYVIANGGTVTIRLVDEAGNVIDTKVINGLNQGDNAKVTLDKTFENDGKTYEIVDENDINFVKQVTDTSQTFDVTYKEVTKLQEDTPKEDAPQEDTPQEDTPKEEQPKEEAPKEDTPKDEAPKEDTPKDEAPKDEAPKEEQPKEDTVVIQPNTNNSTTINSTNQSQPNTTTGSTVNRSNSSSTTKLPNTGATVGIATTLVGLVTSVGAVLLGKRKK